MVRPSALIWTALTEMWSCAVKEDWGRQAQDDVFEHWSLAEPRDSAGEKLSLAYAIEFFSAHAAETWAKNVQAADVSPW